MHQPQAQHFAALPGVRPERVAATRAGGMVVARVDVLAIGAGRAQPPPLDGRTPHVDAANGHLAATGVELVFWGKFAECGHCGTQVVIDNPVVFGSVVLAIGVPENHRVQGDALFRERVIGQQPFVGEKAKGVASVEVGQQTL